MGINKEQYAERIEKLKQDYPAMFSHAELRPDEVCIGEIIIDVVGLNVGTLKANGLPSARRSETPVLKTVKVWTLRNGRDEEIALPNIQFYPVFVDVYEYFQAIEADEKKKQRLCK